MLKTNSKQAQENIKNYIINHFDFSNYEGYEKEPKTFHEIVTFIYNKFSEQKFYTDSYYKAHGIPEQTAFIDWCSGLPSVLDTCYYYNRSAVEDLGKLLEETETEKARFTESEAEKMLSILIYQTIKKEITKNVCTQN